jgi:hypothetical protein
MIKRKRAFSIIEMMIACFLITVAFVSLLKMHTYSLSISTKAKEISTASEDASDIMEKFNAADFPSLTTDFPNGCCIGAAADCGGAPTCPGANDVVLANELLLTNETIVVTYPFGAASNPKGVQIVVSWVGRDGRQHRVGGDGLPIILNNIDTQ